MTKHYNKKTEKDKRRILRKKQTYTEKIFWLHLRNRQLLGHKFRRQYSVDHFVIDFYCPELKLSVELDGDIHNLPEQKEYDIARPLLPLSESEDVEFVFQQQSAIVTALRLRLILGLAF